MSHPLPPDERRGEIVPTNGPAGPRSPHPDPRPQAKRIMEWAAAGAAAAVTYAAFDASGDPRWAIPLALLNAWLAHDLVRRHLR